VEEKNRKIGGLGAWGGEIVDWESREICLAWAVPGASDNACQLPHGTKYAE
jgi:hypothetical protein